MVEKISAVTLRVANMRASVRFYKDVLGLEIIYGNGVITSRAIMNYQENESEKQRSRSRSKPWSTSRPIPESPSSLWWAKTCTAYRELPGAHFRRWQQVDDFKAL